MRLLCNLQCLLYILCIICLPLQSVYSSSAESGLEQEVSLINSYEEDVNGDGFKEYLKLHGNLLSSQSIFYPDVWLDITNPFSQHWKISLQAGYDPDIQFMDLTHDYILDIFYMVAKDVNKREYAYQLYSLQNGTVKQLQLPRHHFMKATFKNDFKIELEVDPHDKPRILAMNEKHKYIEDKIYDEKGKLLITDKKLPLKSIHFIEPVLISEANGYGIKTHQQIIGLFQDEIGELQTLWYFKNGDWINLHSDWIPTEQKHSS